MRSRRKRPRPGRRPWMKCCRRRREVAHEHDTEQQRCTGSARRTSVRDGGDDGGPEAQRAAAAILEVLAGLRTPGQAAEALGVSQARYFQLETRAMQALVASCEARPRGPGRNLEWELAALRRQHE